MMTEQMKRKVGERVAEALGLSGADVLYDPETFDDPERTTASIAALIVATVMEEITRVEVESEQGQS